MSQDIFDNVSPADQEKRKTLKIIGGTALVSFAPSMVGAALTSSYRLPETAEPVDPGIVSLHNRQDTEISIALVIDPEPIVTLINHTDKLIIVRYVYPGIVHAGRVAFDINAIFEHSDHAVSGGTSRSFPILPATGEPNRQMIAKADSYRKYFRSKPVRAASLIAHDMNGLIANSTRTFFS